MWELEASIAVTDAGLLVAATDIVRNVVDAVDKACSRFRPDSELMRLQPRMAQGVGVSPTFRCLLERALDAARMTDGDVDPTLGADLAVLGHGPEIPADAQQPEHQFWLEHQGLRSVPVGPLASLPETPSPRLPGWSRLRLRVLPADTRAAGPQPPAFTDGGPAILTMPPDLRLDLGASAKAVAADLAAAEVHRKLGCGVLVGLGGDFASAGPGPGTEGTPGSWQILVQDLPADPAQQISLAPGFALATSSTQKRRWKHQGRQVHHILDPRFGLPAEAVWRSVTVAAPTCLEANAFSTAAIVRGFAAVEWFRREGIPARLVDSRGRVTTTGGWPVEDCRPA
ncbi:MAG: FAD:protein FMN transferase, partial [Actinomycetes bacterium]